VNWFVHKKASLEPAEALERLLQNWTFITLLSSKKSNLRLTAFRRVPAQVNRSSRTQTETLWMLPKTSLTSAKDSYKEGVFHWREKLLSQPSCKQSEQPCLCCREEPWGGWESASGSKSQVCATRPGVCNFASTVNKDCTALHTREGQGERQTLRWYLATETGWRLQDSPAKLTSFSRGWCSYTHCMCGTRLDRHRLHRIHCQRWMATKLSGPESTGLLSREDMLEHYHTLQPKPKSIDELKDALQSIWDELPEN